MKRYCKNVGRTIVDMIIAILEAFFYLGFGAIALSVDIVYMNGNDAGLFQKILSVVGAVLIVAGIVTLMIDNVFSKMTKKAKGRF